VESTSAASGAPSSSRSSTKANPASTRSRRTRSLSRSPPPISAVTYAEILVHPLRQADERTVDEFLELARISIVPIDRAIAAAAARLPAFETRKLPDAITRATADACGAELATFDDPQRDRHAAARGGHTPPERST
jgi:predicted nucleic acid-binding protein